MALSGRPGRPIKNLCSRIPELSRHALPSLSRAASSNKNVRWLQRKLSDKYSKDAKSEGLASRAAYKLMELDDRHRIFKTNQVVVDLGFAPGSWSQIALNRTKPFGKVIGIDLLPVNPTPGATAIQGNFLDPAMQEKLKQVLRDDWRGKMVKRRRLKEGIVTQRAAEQVPMLSSGHVQGTTGGSRVTASVAEPADPTTAGSGQLDIGSKEQAQPYSKGSIESREAQNGVEDISVPNPNHLVDVVLCDMLMNTSGIPTRDHEGSMELVSAALKFAMETLKYRGHFICKYYDGSGTAEVIRRVKKLFGRVYRHRPAATQKESKEVYLVCLDRNHVVDAGLESH